MTKYSNLTGRGGAGRGQGRKSREELGKEPTINTTVRIEPSVVEACKEKHGSIANALRFAAKQTNKPKSD